MEQNQRIVLVERPEGMPDERHLRLESVPVPTPEDGQVLLKTIYLSLDPYMRGRMSAAKSYAKSVELGEVMEGGTVSQVVASRHPDWQEGDLVLSHSGWQTYALSNGRGLRRLDPSLAPISTALGVLGMPGFTAYVGLLEIGQPKAGETVVVSAASGAVGQVVGQIAKLKGCRVVGIAGGKEKCDFLTGELGFDAAVDYKRGDLKAALRAACPEGVDVFFDNVGGDILDTVLTRLRMHARIVICGAISQYNNTTPVKGPSNYLSLLVNRARMQGMVVFDYADRYAEAAREMAGWMREGRLKHREHIVEGLETFPERLLMLFRGENFGKLVLKVADD